MHGEIVLSPSITMPLTRFYPTVNTSLKPFCYVPNGWDTAWRAALANRAVTPASVVALGDSMTVGTGADVANLFTQPYFWLLRATLISSYGLNSDSWLFANDGLITPGILTFGGSWSSGSAYGGHANVFPSNTSSTVTIAPPSAFTAFDFVHVPFVNGSTLTYAIDGGATNTINVATNGGYAVRVSVTGLANTTHSVAFANISAGSATQFQAFITYPSGTATSGISFFNCSRTGAGCAGYRTGRNWQGAISSGTPTGFGLPYRADLMMVNMGVNELLGPGGQKLDPEDYHYTWRKTIQALRRGTPNASVLLIAACVPESVSSDAGDWSTAGANSQWWQLYTDRLHMLGLAFNCAVVNFGAKWGETPLGQGFLQTTNVHPTIVGHQDMANTILPLIQ